jgi:hypothetical protein
MIATFDMLAPRPDCVPVERSCHAASSRAIAAKSCNRNVIAAKEWLVVKPSRRRFDDAPSATRGVFRHEIAKISSQNTTRSNSESSILAFTFWTACGVAGRGDDLAFGPRILAQDLDVFR